MKYYRDPVNGDIYAYNEDTLEQYLKEGLSPLSDAEYAAFIDAMDLEVQKGSELGWAAAEMQVVANQLLMLEDEDPTALPGTAREWRDYRVALRAWKEGAEGFPREVSRPARPRLTRP
ncbi:hypothetical protein [Pseudomonas putida]|uniref:hypothetical protein n=1 Tax=Pseudomonas putida TaxID=303 RepID=UPI00236730BE|nr:hypothetical protein [Pseudomonas putida]MDD2046084.1 hypothetical protein [Pseudomonas putida]